MSNNDFAIENGVLTSYKGPKVKELTIPEGVKITRCTLYDYDSLLTVHFPDSLEKLGMWMFSRCPRLKEVNLPENLREIGGNCFSNTAISEIIIPESVEIIGEMAFSDCKRLRKVVLKSSNINVSGNAFVGCKDLKLYCKANLCEVLNRLLNVPCFPLEKFEEESDSFECGALNNAAGSDSSAIKISDRVEFESLCDGIAFKVIFNPEITMKDLVLDFISECYSLKEAERNYLTKEEARRLYERTDPNHKTEAYMYATASIDPSADCLSNEQINESFEALLNIYRSLANQDCVNRITADAPKKKDKTLVINRVTKIAFSDIVFGDCHWPSVVAKSVSADTLEVSIRNIIFSPEELEQFKAKSFYYRSGASEKNVGKNIQEKTESIQPEAKPDFVSLEIDNNVVRIPSVLSEDDKRAIVFFPDKAFEDYPFIKKADENRYIIEIPDFSSSVISEGISASASFNNESFMKSWKIMSFLSECANSEDKSQDYFDAAYDSFKKQQYVNFKKYDLPRISNNLIANYAHAILTSFESIITNWDSYVQKMADNIKKTKTGTFYKELSAPICFDRILDIKNLGCVPLIQSLACKDGLSIDVHFECLFFF